MTTTPTARLVRVASCALFGVLASTSIGRAGGGGGALPAYSAVALQTADPSCRVDVGLLVFSDCGNGTVTDNRSGLVWLENADCLGAAVDWLTAVDFVAGLADMPAGSDAADQDCGLSDSSSPGEWRLPSVAEWEAMVSEAVVLDCHPAITNDAGTLCWSDPCHIAGQCAFSPVQSTFYWSATPAVTAATSAWSIDLEFGAVGFGSQSSLRRVWPVRGGQ